MKAEQITAEINRRNLNKWDIVQNGKQVRISWQAGRKEGGQEMKKANKELLRLALEEYREACYRMQAESERCREMEYGEYDESKRPDPEAWSYWISAMDGLETAVESVLFDE